MNSSIRVVALVIIALMPSVPIAANGCALLGLEPGSTVDSARRILGPPAKLHSYEMPPRGAQAVPETRQILEWEANGHLFSVEADSRGEIQNLILRVDHGSARAPFGVEVGEDTIDVVCRKVGSQFIEVEPIRCSEDTVLVSVAMSCGPEGSTTLTFNFVLTSLSTRSGVKCGDRLTLEKAKELASGIRLRSVSLSY